MNLKNYFSLLFLLPIFCTTIGAQNENKKNNFLGDPVSSAVKITAEPNLVYSRLPLTVDGYKTFLDNLNTKDKKLYDAINGLLQESGLSKGIGDFNSDNAKFVTKIKTSNGTYGTLMNFSKVADFGGTMDAFLIKTPRGPIYFLTSGFLFYSTDYDIIYDFQSNELRNSSNQRIRDFKDVKAYYKKPFRLKVINVNRYLYTVRASFDDEFLISNEPELFKKLFKGEGFDLSLLTALAKSEAVEGAALIPPDPTVKPLIESYMKLKLKYNALLSNYIDAYSICPPKSVACCDQKSGAENFKDLSEELAKLNTDYLALKSSTTAEISSTEAEKEKLTAKLATAKTAKDKKQINADLQVKTTKITELNARKLLLTELGTVLADITDEKLSILVLFDNNFISENYEIDFPAVYPKGDNLIFTMDIEPNSNETTKRLVNVPLKEIHIKDDFRVRNKWFYSFSTGPFAGLDEKFRPETYGWQAQPGTSGTIDDTSTYKIVQNGKAGVPVGIAAFANLGVKLSNFYALGGSVGVGATISEKIHPAYFFGITNFFGQDKQFNVTLGLAFIEVEKLKNDLYQGIGTQLYSAPIDLEYVKKMEAGFFVSLSYTIFSSTKVNRMTAGKASAPALAAAETEEESTSEPAATN